MCGIAGYLSKRTSASRRLGLQMVAQVGHRGPDAYGCWTDEDAGVTVAHRRLSILDLSEAGQQPMVSCDGRYILVYNGEIYNHRSIREQVVAGGWPEPFAGHSDTETLLALIQMRGVEAALPLLNGMFAFALWDTISRRLTLARDRIGEKPLYYGWAGGTFLFGSELKALVCHPDWQGEIDRDVVRRYFQSGYVPDPFSIYRDICKLAPASFVHISLDQAKSEETPVPYWTLPATAAARPIGALSDAEAISAVHSEMMRAVGSRMEADVPLGAFLSGGIDSSTVVAMMQAQSSKPVRTFTVGFNDAAYNEAGFAKQVAHHLGTDHTEVFLNPDDALALIPRLCQIWDEPFADSSQLPTLLLARVTAGYVKVALSGDGGDEIFGGYNRYGQGYSHYQAISRMPYGMRRLAGAALSVLSRMPDNRLVKAILDRVVPLPGLGFKLQKLASVADAGDIQTYYRRLVAMPDMNGLLIDAGEIPSPVIEWPDLGDPREDMAYMDVKTYLPGDILTKVDRATMSVSLEARAPFLDHELIEQAWQLPYHFKIRDGQTKWVLRRILDKYVPGALFDRPKMGFGVPLDRWLPGPLRDWAESLISPERLRREGYLSGKKVHRLWADFLGGQEWRREQIWTVLMFQQWLENECLPNNSAEALFPMETAI